MPDQHRSDQQQEDPTTVPQRREKAGAAPEGTVDFVVSGSTDGSLPAGGSVLQALAGNLSGGCGVRLRQLEDETTLVSIRAEASSSLQQEMPARYQLVGELARGGMGAVFVGRDIELGRDIAV